MFLRAVPPETTQENTPQGLMGNVSAGVNVAHAGADGRTSPTPMNPYYHLNECDSYNVTQRACSSTQRQPTSCEWQRGNEEPVVTILRLRL